MRRTQPYAGPNQPAVFVNWYEARAYCQAKGGDLPTGDQWEKAARGPQGYEHGTHSGALRREEANYDSDATVDVNSYPPNGYGVKNMTGNVLEWTLEDLNGNKGVRGGSWYFNNPEFLAASYRYDFFVPGFRSFSVGFRCVVPSQDSKK